LSDDANEAIARALDGLDGNPGDAIVDAVPDLRLVLDDPAVQGTLVSLLGPDYETLSHRHWHCKAPGSASMHWHQDSVNNRDPHIALLLGMYYPSDVTAEMGPTIILPGTQFRNAPTDRMATYSNIRGQVPLTVAAGTVAFTHYDLWHGTAANRSPVKRHMIKFLFRRKVPNTAPTWRHDPAACDRPHDWQHRERSEYAGDILVFANPLGVSQTDHYKERVVRQACWARLLGKGA
jgi:hypothetical protein